MCEIYIYVVKTMIQYKLTGSTFLFEFLTSILTHFAGVPPSNHCALILVDKYVFPHIYINPLIFVHSSFSVNIYIYICVNFWKYFILVWFMVCRVVWLVTCHSFVYKSNLKLYPCFTFNQ